jgi:hypothetical protein
LRGTLREIQEQRRVEQAQNAAAHSNDATVISLPRVPESTGQSSARQATERNLAAPPIKPAPPEKPTGRQPAAKAATPRDQDATRVMILDGTNRSEPKADVNPRSMAEARNKQDATVVIDLPAGARSAPADASTFPWRWAVIVGVGVLLLLAILVALFRS